MFGWRPYTKSLCAAYQPCPRCAPRLVSDTDDWSPPMGSTPQRTTSSPSKSTPSSPFASFNREATQNLSFYVPVGALKSVTMFSDKVRVGYRKLMCCVPLAWFHPSSHSPSRSLRPTCNFLFPLFFFCSGATECPVECRWHHGALRRLSQVFAHLPRQPACVDARGADCPSDGPRGRVGHPRRPVGRLCLGTWRRRPRRLGRPRHGC